MEVTTTTIYLFICRVLTEENQYQDGRGKKFKPKNLLSPTEGEFN